MAQANEHMRDEAAAWAVRTGDPGFAEWDAFVAWLEANPAHAAAYDAVQARLAEVVEAGLPAPAPAERPVRPLRRRWIGGGIAVAAAVAVAVGAWQTLGVDAAIETAPGETRTVQLADGSSIALSGGTRIELDADAPRSATLAHGQALFTIRHDASQPFRVRAGGHELVDLGTVFDVERGAGTTRVAVAEGLVLFEPAGARVRVAPGQQLTAVDGAGPPRLLRVPVGQVGEWREGRLSYAEATLDEVARDLSRTTGVAIDADDAVRDRAFSGSLRVDPVRADPRTLGPLLDVEVRREGDGWRLVPQR